MTPTLSPPGEAAELLAANAAGGARVIAIGPYTNLAAAERARAGVLARCPVTLMGGWIAPPAVGLPQWGPEMDWNVQCDTTAAMEVVAAADDLLLATLPATMAAYLRVADLHRLERAGPVGALLARQARAHGTEHDMGQLGRAHALLPQDLLNFQYDPVACAAAIGWDGTRCETQTLSPHQEEDGVLRFVKVATGKPMRVLTEVDETPFSETWLHAIEAIASRSMRTASSFSARNMPDVG